jgi:hypothetical protein
MNKEFIPYEQALELKELGFDEPCLASYETAFSKNRPYFEIGYIISGPKNYVLTPTFSQAFRFFREKHGLVMVIKPIDDKRLELGYNITKNGLIIKACLTYEKAELACLIKLIEIVKEKK